MSPTTDDNPKNEVRDLALVAQAIFSGNQNFVPLTSGKPAIIKPASVKQLPAILGFLRAMLEGMDQVALSDLLIQIANKQKAAIAEGKDPNALDIGSLGMTGDDMEGMARKAFGNVSLVMSLFIATAEEMPKLAAACTNLSEAEYEALPPDDGILLAAGILVANYAFFIRSLPPILTGFMRSRASQTVQTVPASATKKALVKRRRT